MSAVASNGIGVVGSVTYSVIEDCASRFDLRLGTVVARVEPGTAGIRLHLATTSGLRSIEVEALLIAIWPQAQQ